MEESKEYLPNCWNDEARMNAYFSPLRSSANPEGLQYKIAFWEKAIERFCHVTNTTVFSLEELNKSFARNGKIPQCFEDIIEHMIRNKELCELHEFMNMKPSSHATWAAWVWEMGKMPMDWAWEKVKKTVFKRPLLIEDKFVHKRTVQVKAEDVLLKASDVRGQVVSVNTLMQKCSIPEAKIESMLVTLHHLHCQNKAALLNFDLLCPSKLLVKLADVDQRGPVIISETDQQKFELLELSNKLELKIKEYEKKCNSAQDEARNYLTKKSKTLALSQLKKKKIYEQLIEKDANVLLNIHKLIETIHDSETNREVVEALKKANTAIKNTNKEANMSEESVTDVMDDVRETIEAQNDMSLALSGPISDEDVEREFEELEKDIAEEEDLSKMMEDLKIPGDLSKLGDTNAGRLQDTWSPST